MTIELKPLTEIKGISPQYKHFINDTNQQSLKPVAFIATDTNEILDREIFAVYIACDIDITCDYLIAKHGKAIIYSFNQ